MNEANTETLTGPQSFTPREAFENIKPKLISKYGEDVVNALVNDYNRGELLSITEKENYIDNIIDKAKEVKLNFEASIKRNEVYKFFDMDEKTAEKAIKEMLEKDSDLNEIAKEGGLNNPAFVKKVLKLHMEKIQGEQNKMAMFGKTANGNTMTKSEMTKEYMSLVGKPKLTREEHERKLFLSSKI